MIAAITSSGRINSNSSFLLGKALEAASGGETVSFYDLSKLAFKGCTGCGACRSGAGSCIVMDDLSEVLDAVATARAVLLASPNYYGYTSGIFKAFLDRWYSFRDGERKLKIPEGRPLLFIFSQGHPDPEAYPHTLSSLEKIFSGYGFAPKILVAPGLEKAGSAAKSSGLIEKAMALGAELRKSK
ncbi:flavodoxin family protein [bacterium]|nr:MAG: flavodoxin family protein [bacterium]